jgi:hypothetical protein
MMAQRLTAARAGSFAGGLVAPAVPCEPDEAVELARNLAQQSRQRFDAGCAFASAPHATLGKASAVFLTPEDEEVWDLRFSSLSEIHQLRATVAGLERMRRHLAGVTAPEL